MPTLNPQIRTIEIGVKSLREITLYPLSLADQFSVSDIVAEGVAAYEEQSAPKPKKGEDGEVLVNPADGSIIYEEQSDVEDFSIIIKLIEANLLKILKLATDANENITLADFTNDQFVDICEVIYDVNFDNAAGKFKTLLSRVKSSFQLKKPSARSSLVPLTDTNISSDSPGSKEE